MTIIHFSLTILPALFHWIYQHPAPLFQPHDQTKYRKLASLPASIYPTRESHTCPVSIQDGHSMQLQCSTQKHVPQLENTWESRFFTSLIPYSVASLPSVGNVPHDQFTQISSPPRPFGIWLFHEPHEANGIPGKIGASKIRFVPWYHVEERRFSLLPWYNFANCGCGRRWYKIRWASRQCKPWLLQFTSFSR